MGPKVNTYGVKVKIYGVLVDHLFWITNQFEKKRLSGIIVILCNCAERGRLMGVSAGIGVARIAKGESLWGASAINFCLIKNESKYIIDIER